MDPKRTADSSESHFTLEEAFDKTGFGKFNYFLIVLTGAILGCVFLETVSINFILPVAQCDLNLSTQDKGILSGIGFVGIIVSSHLWGFLADTRGRKSVIVPTLFVAFAITLISSFVKSFPALVVLRLLNGICVSGPSATIYAYLGEFHSLKQRGRVLMFASTCYAIACFWNPIFATLIINQSWSFYIEILDLDFKPWRLFMIICGTPNIVCAIIMIFMPESPKFTYSHGDETETLKIMKKVYVCNTGESKLTFPVKSLVKDDEFLQNDTRKSMGLFSFMWSQTVPLFKHPHLRNTLTACFIQFSIFNSSNGFWTFFPEITNRISMWESVNSVETSATVCEILDQTKVTPNLNLTINDSLVCVSHLEFSAFTNAFILNFLYFFGWLFLAFIINRVGKLIIITSLLFSCGLCALAITFVTSPTAASYLYIMLLGVGLALTVLNASSIELFPTRLRAMALSLSLMSGRLGAVFGTNLIGAILDDYCPYTFMMPTILLITSACLAFTIPNISNRNK